MRIEPCILAIVLLLGCGSSSKEPAEESPSPMIFDPYLRLHSIETLPLMRPGERAAAFSSYDRTGGNNDGFWGTWSALRIEDGNSVIAEMAGAGVITRLWTTHSGIWRDGLLGRRAEHIQVFVDGGTEPMLNTEYSTLFDDSNPEFPAPLAGSDIGGFFSYIPIPFRDGCKVVLEGTGVRFYHLSWTALPDGMQTAGSSGRAKAVDVWSRRGTELDLQDVIETTLPFDLAVGGVVEVDLPSGPRAIREIVWEGGGEDVTFELYWDGEPTPSIAAPLGLVFGQAWGTTEYRSLLVGRTNDRGYNRFPMPYSRSARLRLQAASPAAGRIVVRTTPWADSAWGHLHARHIKALQTQTGEPIVILERQGRGHYVGLFLATTGPEGSPEWLEGDERVYIGGELVAHGTGTEDFFGAGWYDIQGRLEGPGTQALQGFSVYEELAAIRTASYRWLLADAIPWEDSIRIELEHGPTNNIVADYWGVSWWYEAQP